MPGAALDRDALTRGNSVYFPDRVVPMLPHVLSDQLCSLQPDVDRLCLVADMQISQSGALAEEIVAKSNEIGIPVGTVVSVGNAMQIGVADHLTHLANDDGIGAILLYIESPGDQAAFRKAARLAAAKKPVVALIGGRTAIGSGVMGGTISATVLGVLFVPVFFVIVARITHGRNPLVPQHDASDGP